MENETLRGQVQELHQQLAVTRQGKSTFEKKVAELQQRSDMLDRKLKEKHSGPVTPPSTPPMTPPVPKPRTMVQTGQIEKLQAEKQRLENEKQQLETEKRQMTGDISSLQEQVQREQQARTMAESLLGAANSKAQSLGQEHFQLKQQLEQAQAAPPSSVSLQSLGEQNRRKDSQIAQLNDEILGLKDQVQRNYHAHTMAESHLESANNRVTDLQRKCATLEKEKSDIKKELTAQLLKEKDKAAAIEVARQETEKEKAVSGLKNPQRADKRLEKRLSDALVELNVVKKVWPLHFSL